MFSWWEKKRKIVSDYPKIQPYLELISTEVPVLETGGAPYLRQIFRHSYHFWNGLSNFMI